MNENTQNLKTITGQSAYSEQNHHIGNLCPTCCNTNPFGFSFCGRCGEKIDRIGNLKTSPPSKLPERKHVTVLFSDITGYTEISEKLDPEDINQITRQLFSGINQIVKKHDGIVSKYLGDAAMILFGIPISHEDDPIRAIKTAKEIHEYVQKKISPRYIHKTGRPLSMHTGINTGLVVTAGTETNGFNDVTGDTVNIASRLTGISKEEEITVGPETYLQSNTHYHFEKKKPSKIKGKKKPIDTYKVLYKREQPVTHLQVYKLNSDFIGRKKSFTKIKNTIDHLKNFRKGKVVSIIGDAGIGKSRLIAHTKLYLKDNGITWHEGKSFSYGQTQSYGAIIEIIKKIASINSEETGKSASIKLEKTIKHLFPVDHQEVLPYLSNLLNIEIKEHLKKRTQFIDSEAMGHQIFRATYQLFKNLAGKNPLVLIFEDTHWLDDASLQLIQHILPLVSEVPLIVFSVGRPAAMPFSEFLINQSENIYRPYTHSIYLSSLGEIETRKLIDNLLGEENIPPEFHKLIFKRSEGNPFFVEEIIRSLIDQKILVKLKNSKSFKVARQVETISIPPTLRGLIVDRIDQLDDDIKQIVKLASIIGRNFLYSILKTVSESGHNFDNYVNVLKDSELIRSKQQHINDLEYIFQHALTQEAAYDSILKQHRKGLHLKVGSAIERLFPERLDEFYSKLAYHFANAKEWDKAQNYLFKAGDQACAVAADSEALEHYKLALHAYEKKFGAQWDTFHRAVLERKMGEAYFRKGDHYNATICFQKSLSLFKTPFPSTKWRIRIAGLKAFFIQCAHRLLPCIFAKEKNTSVDPETTEIYRIYEVMAWIDYFMNRERLVLNAISGLNHAEKKGVVWAMAKGAMGMGLICDTLGAFKLAGYYSKKSLSLSKKTNNPVIIGLGHLGFAVHKEFTGRWTDAISFYSKSADAYWEAGDIRKWGNSTIWAAFLNAFLGNVKDSSTLSEKVYQVGKESGDHLLQGWGLHGKGVHHLYTGEMRQAESTLIESIRFLNKVPDHYDGAQAYTDLGKCYLHMGEITSARSILKEAEKKITEHNLKGPMVTFYKNTVAQLYLAETEQNGHHHNKTGLKKLKKACKNAIKASRKFAGGRPQAYRIKGSYLYLKGNKKAARTMWKKSIKASENLGAIYEKALTCFEMDRWQNNKQHFEIPQKIFQKLNMGVDADHGDYFLVNNRIPPRAEISLKFNGMAKRTK